MKIIGLVSENVKRINLVEMKPDGHLVEITGKNGNGKSSLLDSIWFALAGAEAIQEEPIRKGAEEALIKLDLGRLLVTRTFRKTKDGRSTNSLKIETPEGMTAQKPQTMLDGLIGKLSFDPLEFTRMKPADQFDRLKALVPDFDFAAMAVAQKADFQARTEINRDAKTLRTRAEGIVVPDDAPKERVDTAGIIAELEGASAENAKVERERQRRQAKREFIAGAQRDVDALKQRIAALQEELEEGESSIAETQKEIDAFGEMPIGVDPSEIRARLEKAEAVNAVFDRVERRSELIGDAEIKEADAKQLTQRMEKRDADKLAAIAKAKIPVDGLTFADDRILLNELPFDQASQAEQLRASIAIAAAMNPQIRVICVRDGALLDSDSMQIVADMAKTMDMQVWVETVSSDRAGAVVIEDGRVKGAPAKEKPTKEAAE